MLASNLILHLDKPGPLRTAAQIQFSQVHTLDDRDVLLIAREQQPSWPNLPGDFSRALVPQNGPATLQHWGHA